MLRSRDFVAALLVVALVRMAWNANMESLTASIHLAFYLPRDDGTNVAHFDLDGDGTSEALAVIKKGKTKGWVLQILDLKPLHQLGGKTHLAPFQPKVLYQTAEFAEAGAEPLGIATGQVQIEKPENYASSSSSSKAASGNAYASNHEPKTDLHDRSKNYFCGKDWHDAASRCGKPCPDGRSADCPDGETCYADTPCDSSRRHRHNSGQPLDLQFQLTPGGGFPSIAVLWSNGVVTMHNLSSGGLFENLGIQGNGSKDKKKRKSKTTSKDLSIQRLWRVPILPLIAPKDEHFLWTEPRVRFLDAYESEASSSEHGVIIISGRYRVEEDSETNPDDSNVVAAINAFSGKILWDSLSSVEESQDAVPLPLHRGSTSYARRRSRIASLHQDSVHGTAIQAGSLPSCQMVFKNGFLNTMPHSYWSVQDADIFPMHLDHKTKHKRMDGGNHGNQHERHVPSKGPHHQHPHRHHSHDHNHRGHGGHGASSRSNRKSAHKGGIQFGRPNVLVSTAVDGVHIRSLKNGRLLCHMSMMDEVLHADVNGDNIIDQIKLVLPWHDKTSSDTFVWNLLRKMTRDGDGSGEQTSIERSARTVCHAMGLSGLPAREELFSASVCGSQRDRPTDFDDSFLDAVPPIVVESLNGRRDRRDVIVALNNGVVTRLQGNTGRRQWSTGLVHQKSYPTWHEEGVYNALLTRVDSGRIAPSVRPIVVAGEDGLAILSVKNGDVLASTKFPQTSVKRPIMVELSGDETSDMLVTTSTAVWGYQIVVHPGNFIVIRTIIGIVLMGLMLAILRNRFGQRKDRRSTDA